MSYMINISEEGFKFFNKMLLKNFGMAQVKIPIYFKKKRRIGKEEESMCVKD